MFRRALPTLTVAALVLLLCLPGRTIGAGIDGVIKQRGKMMTMKGGKAIEPMTAKRTMSNGATVMLDGTVTLPTGEEVHLKDGQMIMLDGTIMDGGKPKAMMKPERLGPED